MDINSQECAYRQRHTHYTVEVVVMARTFRPNVSRRFECLVSSRTGGTDVLVSSRYCHSNILVSSQSQHHSVMYNPALRVLSSYSLSVSEIEAFQFVNLGVTLRTKVSPSREFSTCISTWQFPLNCAFYRAMHFSAKRGIAIACRLSVRPSVCDVGEL